MVKKIYLYVHKVKWDTVTNFSADNATLLRHSVAALLLWLAPAGPSVMQLYLWFCVHVAERAKI